MLLDVRRITARCIPRTTFHVATAFIQEDGGRRNISAKLIATLWYLLILPDSHSRLNRQLHRKRVPWYAPSRIIGIALAAANMVALPASWVLLFAGKKNAARIASLGVLANPPSITISLLLLQEIAGQISKLSAGLAVSTGSLLAKPVMMIMNKNTQDQSNDSTPATTTTTTTTTPAPTPTAPTPTPTPTPTTTATTTTPPPASKPAPEGSTSTTAPAAATGSTDEN